MTSFAALLFLLPVLGYTQSLAIYDDFSGPTLDNLKWRVQDLTPSTTFETLRVRKVAAGELRLAITSRGATTSSIGTADSYSAVRVGHALLVNGQPPITVLKAKVTIKSAVAEDCPDAGSDATYARAHMEGFFFNDATGSNDASDYTGDMIACIDLERHSRIAEHRVVGHINRCTNASCSAVQTLKYVVFAYQWSEDIASNVTIRWVPESEAFEFTVTAGVTSETHLLTYADLGLSDPLPPQDISQRIAC